MSSNIRKYFGVGLGALVLSGATVTLCYQALAQGESAQQQPGQPRRPGAARPQAPGQPGEPQDGFGGPGGFGGGPGGGGRGGFGGGPGGPGGFGGPGGPGMGMMMGGGASMTANATTVFVMRGNQLLAFDAGTLRLKAQTELPMPQPPGGFGGPNGFGGPGGPDPRGGGRPQRPGGNQ